MSAYKERQEGQRGWEGEPNQQPGVRRPAYGNQETVLRGEDNVLLITMLRTSWMLAAHSLVDVARS